MTRGQRPTVRKPATKFAQLRKKMEQRKSRDARPGIAKKK